MSNTPHPSSQSRQTSGHSLHRCPLGLFSEGFLWSRFWGFFFIYTLRIVRLEEVKRGCLSPCVICAGLGGTAGSSRSEVLPPTDTSSPCSGLCSLPEGFGWDWGGGCPWDSAMGLGKGLPLGQCLAGLHWGVLGSCSRRSLG